MSDTKQQEKPQPKGQSNKTNPTEIEPKPESSSEYEGADSRKPTGNQGEVKTETSSSSGE